MTLSTQDEEPSVHEYADSNSIGMTLVQRRFYASEQCLATRLALQRMVESPQYNTEASHSNGDELDFVDRHLHYLSTHPVTQLAGYLSNLRLMTRVRPGQ